MFFQLLCIFTDTYLKRFFKNAHKYWYLFIQNQTGPDYDGTVKELTDIHRALQSERCYFGMNMITIII